MIMLNNCEKKHEQCWCAWVSWRLCSNTTTTWLKADFCFYENTTCAKITVHPIDSRQRECKISWKPSNGAAI